MEKISNAVYGVVCLVVIVILVVTIGIPVVEDAQKEQVVISQNTTELFACSESAGDASISITVTDGVISVNDYAIPEISVNRVRLIVSSDNILIFGNNGGRVSLCEPTGGYIGTATDVSIESGVLSYVASSVTHTVDIEGKLYYASSTGDYGFFWMDNAEPYKFNKDSIFIMGVYQQFINSSLDPTTTGAVHGLFKGTYDSLEYVFSERDTIISGTGHFAGIEEKTIHLETTSNTKCYLSVTTADGVYSLATTGTGFIAPLEYTTLTENGSMIYQLLNVIPLMLLIIPVMGAVAMISRRD